MRKPELKKRLSNPAAQSLVPYPDCFSDQAGAESVAVQTGVDDQVVQSDRDTACSVKSYSTVGSHAGHHHPRPLQNVGGLSQNHHEHFTKQHSLVSCTKCEIRFSGARHQLDQSGQDVVEQIPMRMQHSISYDTVSQGPDPTELHFISGCVEQPTHLETGLPLAKNYLSAGDQGDVTQHQLSECPSCSTSVKPATLGIAHCDTHLVDHKFNSHGLSQCTTPIDIEKPTGGHSMDAYEQQPLGPTNGLYLAITELHQSRNENEGCPSPAKSRPSAESAEERDHSFINNINEEIQATRPKHRTKSLGLLNYDRTSHWLKELLTPRGSREPERPLLTDRPGHQRSRPKTSGAKTEPPELSSLDARDPRNPSRKSISSDQNHSTISAGLFRNAVSDLENLLNEALSLAA